MTLSTNASPPFISLPPLLVGLALFFSGALISLQFLFTGNGQPPLSWASLILMLSGTWCPAIGGIWLHRQREAEISDLREQQARTESIQRYAFDKTHSGFLVLDQDGRVEDSNQAQTALTGYVLEELKGKELSLFDIALIGEASRIEDLIDQQRPWEGEATLRHQSGELRAVWLQLAPIQTTPRATLLSLTNIASLKAAGDNLAHMTHYEPLTGLPNRILFKEKLRQALREAETSNTQGAVVLLDLQNFKAVNNEYGVDRGDQILVEIGKRLSKALYGTDVAARFGGDEFGLILRDLNAQAGLEQALSRIRAALSAPFEFEGKSIHLGIAFGSALYPDQGKTVSDLLKFADTALYEAKRKGGDVHIPFSNDLQDELIKASELRIDLAKALERDELRLVYQPILSRDGVTVVGAEALLRWHHSSRGELPPGLFIPIAEQSGLIHSIGYWVMEEAARQRAVWANRVDEDFFVAVNVSAHQLANEEFSHRLKESLSKNDLSPQSMQFELTEGVFLEEMELSQKAFRDLADLGIRFALDDFGSGYASLPFLKTLPINCLKVDGAFIARVPDNETELSLVNAIVQVSKSLGLTVVAEGIDQVDHLNALADVPFDLLQGNYFCRALEVTMFEERYF